MDKNKFKLPVFAFLFIRRLKKWMYYENTCGGRVGGRAASTGFLLSKSKSFHQIFIKYGEYVGGHNYSTYSNTSQIPYALLNYGP